MVVTKKIGILTKGECDLIDITAQVEREVLDSGITTGTVTLFINGSTAGISTIEYESGLVSDFPAMWDRIVPRNISYQHDRRWGDGNGHSHVRASLLGPSLVVPFTDRILHLGTWQQIFHLECDVKPRRREVVVTVVGE